MALLDPVSDHVTSIDWLAGHCHLINERFGKLHRLLGGLIRVDDDCIIRVVLSMREFSIIMFSILPSACFYLGLTAVSAYANDRRQLAADYGAARRDLLGMPHAGNS